MKVYARSVMWAVMGMVVILLGVIVGCQALTPQQQQTIQQAATVPANTAAGLRAIAAELRVTPPVTTQSVGAANTLEKAAEQVDKGVPVAQAIAAASSQPGATPLTVIFQGAAAAADSGAVPEPYAGYIKLAEGLVGLAGAVGVMFGWIKNNKANASDAATASVTNAVQAGIAAGKITVAPGAVAVVDAAVNGHPATDAIVDVMAAGGGSDPRVVGK